MPVDRLEPLGTVQRIPELEINSRITNRANEPHYTCPTGKKAIFTGFANCTSLGAASSVNLRDPTNTFNICTWVSVASGLAESTLIRRLGHPYALTIQLEAGDTITSTQSSGTNAEFNVIGKILELPA